MYFLTISLHVSWFTSFQRVTYLNPSISSLELSWYRFHLKPSIGNVAIMVLIYDPISASHLEEGVFISLLISIQLIDSVSGWSSPYNLGMFSLRPLEIISFVVDFQQLRSTLHKSALSRSVVRDVGAPIAVLFILFFVRSGGIVILLSSSHHLVLPSSCYFLAYPFKRCVVFSFQVLSILSSLASLFNQSAIRICSSLFLVHIVSTGVLACTSCPLQPFFLCLSTYKVPVMSLVPL